MFVPGHLATAVLAAVVVAHLRGRVGATPGAPRSAQPDAPRTARVRHPVSLRWMLLPAALGALTPDLLDKSRMALGGSIYGRTIGHSLLFLVAITAVWVGWMRVRRWRGEDSADPAGSTAASPGSGPGRYTGFGFWVLGVASHAVVDLADDALRGLMRGGLVTSSWFAWPWATPYTHVFWVREPWLTSEWVARLDAWTGGTSPLEAVVLVAAGVWMVARVAGRRGAVGG